MDQNNDGQNQQEENDEQAMKNFMSQLGLNDQQQDGDQEGNLILHAQEDHQNIDNGNGGPLFLNNPASGSQEGETENAFNSRTHHKHQ